MADRYHAPALSVRLSLEDQEWLAKFASHEDISIHALVNDAVRYFRNWHEKGNQAVEELLRAIDYACAEFEKQRRRLHYFEQEYQLQSRRLHTMQREYEKRLWNERNQRRVHEQQIRHDRDYYEQPVRAAETDRNALYNPKVARLLALAVCSESDDEAKVAFAKARALHRLRALFLT